MELHHKVTKEITLNVISKRRVDTVIQSLSNDNIVKHRQRTVYKRKRKLQQSKSKCTPLEENSNELSPSDKSNKESLSSTAQNKTPSVENMLYETIDKEDSVISVEKHIYDNNGDSSKVEPKIVVESWRKKQKRNYSYQVKPNLKSKWRINKKNKKNKKNIDRVKENKNSQRIKPFHWGGSVIAEK